MIDTFIAFIEDCLRDHAQEINEQHDTQTIPSATCPDIDSIIQSIENALSYLRVDRYYTRDLQDWEEAASNAVSELEDIDLEPLRESNEILRSLGHDWKTIAEAGYDILEQIKVEALPLQESSPCPDEPSSSNSSSTEPKDCSSPAVPSNASSVPASPTNPTGAATPVSIPTSTITS